MPSGTSGEATTLDETEYEEVIHFCVKRVAGRVPLIADEHAPTPLSPAQQRLWFVNRFDPASPSYNLPFAVRLDGDLGNTLSRAAQLLGAAA